MLIKGVSFCDKKKQDKPSVKHKLCSGMFKEPIHGF